VTLSSLWKKERKYYIVIKYTNGKINFSLFYTISTKIYFLINKNIFAYHIINIIL